MEEILNNSGYDNDCLDNVSAEQSAEIGYVGGNNLLGAGEEVILQDSKNRRYLITLVEGKTFHSHSGAVEHNAIIGLKNGSYVKARYNENSKNEERKYFVIRPTLADVVLKMPRGAQVIYPKDLGAILVAADIYPGVSVLESGVGSGALSMTLLRAGANLIGYELREDFIEVANTNIEKYSSQIFGSYPGDKDNAASPNKFPKQDFLIKCQDIYQGIEESNLDRILLDLPEPWRVVPFAKEVLNHGGIILSYLPTINQTAILRNTLKENQFILAETFEVLHRSWHIEGQSVRPDHRMVAHTGFITTARLANTD